MESGNCSDDDLEGISSDSDQEVDKYSDKSEESDFLINPNSNTDWTTENSNSEENGNCSDDDLDGIDRYDGLDFYEDVE